MWKSFLFHFQLILNWKMRSAHDIYNRVGVELESLSALEEKSLDLKKIRTVYKNLNNDDLDIMPREVSFDL